MVFPIRLAPLRERADDIPLLVAHFLRALRDDVGRDVTRVEPEAMELLVRHAWPGNVRELRNVVHRAMLSCEGGRIRRGDIPPTLRKARGAAAADDEVLPLAELERRAIRAAMRRVDGRVGDAAKLLGIGRATLYRRLAALGLSDDRSAR